MKLGFVVSFFDFRNDVRRILGVISKDHQVVVFCRSSEMHRVKGHLPQHVLLRPIQEELPTFSNIAWRYTFALMRFLPASKKNYYLMELFKISNLKEVGVKRKATFLFWLHKKLPKIFKYDAYLNRLSFSGKTDLEDIDKLIFFSEVADDFLLARAIRSGLDAVLYVYSWDHPCKHVRFSNRIRYVCWSEAIKSDLSFLQGILTEHIKISGASQFGYLYSSLNEPRARIRKFNFNYIYFGCAIGIRDLVPFELAVVKLLAECTLKESPDLKFVVRPYPVLDQWNLYDDLRSLPNVVIDDDFRGKDFAVTDENIMVKLDTIYFSKAFLHLGTTMGLEAALMGTPSFIIDLGYGSTDGLSLFSFIHQYQNEKYLINESRSNTICDLDDYIYYLRNSNLDNYRTVIDKVRLRFPITSFEEVSNALIYA